MRATSGPTLLAVWVVWVFTSDNKIIFNQFLIKLAPQLDLKKPEHMMKPNFKSVISRPGQVM